MHACKGKSRLLAIDMLLSRCATPTTPPTWNKLSAADACSISSAAGSGSTSSFCCCLSAAADRDLVAAHRTWSLLQVVVSCDWHKEAL
jgi:hypothetical protein